MYYAPNKGLDQVTYFKFDESSGVLTLDGVTQFPAGSGPRHMATHLMGLHSYVVGELNSTLYRCSHDSKGRLIIEQEIRTIPEDFLSENSGAGIVCAPESVYVSNRGHDSVMRLAISPDTGMPLGSSWIKTGGLTPRFIVLNQEQSALIVANEDSDSIFASDLSLTKNSNIRELTKTGSPVCIIFNKGN